MEESIEIISTPYGTYALCDETEVPAALEAVARYERETDDRLALALRAWRGDVKP